MTFALSLLLVLGSWAYTSVEDPAPVTTDESGALVVQPEQPEQPEQQTKSATNSLAGLTLIVLTTNIPTVIFVVIYACEREKFRKKHQQEKMNIQDLE